MTDEKVVVKDQKTVKIDIKTVKKALATAMSNLDKLKGEEAPEEDIKNQESTVLRFKTRLNNLTDEQNADRPSFFRRTTTWIAVGGVAVIAFVAGAVWYTNRPTSIEDTTTETDGNGDKL